MKQYVPILRRCTQIGTMVLMTAGVFHFSPLFFGIMLIGALFFGPVFCGWICPFGFVQELVGMVGAILRRKFHIKVPKLPARLHYARLVVAIGVIAAVFSGFINTPGRMTGVSINMVVLGVILILNLFWPRFFCRTLCPLGGILGLTNFIKIYPVRVKGFCTGCGKCAGKCPVGIDLRQRGNNRDFGCISCMECYAVCPVKMKTTGPAAAGGMRGKPIEANLCEQEPFAAGGMSVNKKNEPRKKLLSDC